MPEFELPIGGPDAWNWFHSRDEFTQGYVTAMFFTEANPDNEEMAEATVADLSAEARTRICADSMAFQATKAFKAAWNDGVDREDMGRDFWYTRNGHGCGFWDGDYEEPHATALDEESERFGNVDVYRGDDGEVHLL